MAATCAWVRDQLEAMVDGDLAEPRVGELRRHLAECGGCRAHHAEACSLPTRLRAVPGPEPPGGLIEDILRRVSGDRVGPMQVWGPLAVEAALFLVVLWYLSGPRGLYALVQHTASDVGAVVGWGLGQADLPAPTGDVFLLVVFALLIVTTLYHLSLLSRRAWLS